MARRGRSRWSLAAMAALVVFAQFAMAAQPCMLAHQPVAPAHQSMAADESCDATPMDARSCLVQCLGDDESVSKPAPFFTAAIAPMARSLDLTLAATRFVPMARRSAPPGGPPLQILYCSYQS